MKRLDNQNHAREYKTPVIEAVPKVEDIGRLTCKQITENEKRATNLLSAGSHCHYQCSPRCA